MARKTKPKDQPRREGREEYVRSGKPVTIGEDDEAPTVDDPPAAPGEEPPVREGGELQP